MIFGTLAWTIELYMTKYIIGENFISGGATLYKNPSNQTVQAEQENIEIDLVSDDDNLTADYLDSISDINEISDGLSEDHEEEDINDFDFG